MKKKSIYITIHLFPLLFPLLCVLIILLVAVLLHFKENISESVSKILFSSGLLAMVSIWGFLVFLIPYAVETIILWWWSRDKDDRRIRKAILLSPLITPVLAVFELFIYAVIIRLDGVNGIKSIFTMSPRPGEIPNLVFVLILYFIIRYAFIGLGFLLKPLIERRKIKQQVL